MAIHRPGLLGRIVIEHAERFGDRAADGQDGEPLPPRGPGAHAPQPVPAQPFGPVPAPAGEPVLPDAALAAAAEPVPEPVPGAHLLELLPLTRWQAPGPARWGEPPEPRWVDELPAPPRRVVSPAPPATAPAAVPAMASPPPAAPVAPNTPALPSSPPTPAAPATPLEPAVAPAWLAQREAALATAWTEYTSARDAAQARPGQAPGWVEAALVTDESGHTQSLSGRPTVFVPEPGAERPLLGWDESGPVHGPLPGRTLEFDEAAFAEHWRATQATQPGAGSTQLAVLYGIEPTALWAQQPGLWALMGAAHAANAGPAPAGVAMADARQLALVDLTMADPQVAELMQRYGGSPAPATSSIALEQVRLHGVARYEQMSRLANAMQAVRSEYSNAMQHAMAHGGPGWVEQPRMATVTDESGATRTEQLFSHDESGAATPLTERFFDPDRFTAWYLQQGGAAHQAFASFYGQSHTTWATDESGARVISGIAFDNPHWQLGGPGGPMSHNELVSIDPNHAPRLNNDGAVGFDFEAGWATHHSNIHQKRDWVGTLVQVAFVAAAAWATGGAAASAGWGVIGSAAAAGAAGSFVSGAMNGDLSLKNVLRGALSGALTAGLVGPVGSALGGGAVGGVVARMTVQGGIQALLGGKFEEGAIAGLASGLAELSGAQMNKTIDDAVKAGTMTAGEAIAARGMARVFSSAVRTLGSPGDPQYAFASDLVGSIVNAGLDATRPPAVPAFTGTVFDDDGNLMPGAVDVNAPASQRYQQLQAALLAQGLPPDQVQSLALNGLLTAGADARTVRGYFVPDESHDQALRDVMAERASLGAAEVGPPEPEPEPTPVRVDENGQVIHLPTVTVTGRRITLADDLAERIGGTLGDLYQQGKDIAAQGLDLAAQGLSLLDVPALQDFQQRTREYLDAKAAAGGLSEAEIILFGTLYAANEALMPTNALDFAGGAGKGITAAAAVIRAGGKADEVAQVVRAESRAVSAATEARVAEVSQRAQAEGLEFISARNGSRGDWNAALNGQLKPNAVYLLDNGHSYVTDNAGRVMRAEGTLDVSRADRNTWQQAAAGHVGGDGYDGGHLIATLFGGAGERINLVPQLSTVNRGEFREMERQLAQAVLDRKTVRVEVSPVYANGGDVPSRIDVKYWIDGVPDRREFRNTPG
jgi:hypothetical protein